METALYTNNNLFRGEVESVGTAYLSTQLKSYSLTNAVDKSLTRERYTQPALVMGCTMLDVVEECYVIG